MSAPGSTLKRSSRRTTSLDAGRVTKRFHSPGLRRLADGRRARREAEHLRRLADAGVDVPRVVDVQRRGRAWELVLEQVDAEPLDALLDRPGRRDGLERRTARELGRLVARLARAGVEHRDLHPGNLLVRPDGTPVVVDLARARARGSFDAGALVRDVVQLLASLRERTSARLRRAALDACAREVGAGASVSPHELEGAARLARRDSVERNLTRWVRESGVLRRVADDLVAVDSEAVRTDEPGARFTLEGERRKRLDAWLVAARLTEHRVPTLAPLRLRTDRVELAAPRGDARVDDGSLGRLLGILHDRGLEPARPLDESDLVATSDGLGLHPAATGVALGRIDPRRLDAEDRYRALRDLRVGPPSPELLVAYRAELRGGARERRVLDHEAYDERDEGR